MLQILFGPSSFDSSRWKSMFLRKYSNISWHEKFPGEENKWNSIEKRKSKCWFQQQFLVQISQWHAEAYENQQLEIRVSNKPEKRAKDSLTWEAPISAEIKYLCLTMFRWATRSERSFFKRNESWNIVLSGFSTKKR